MSRTSRPAILLTLAALTVGTLAQVPPATGAPSAPTRAAVPQVIGDPVSLLADTDVRGVIAPTAAQRAAASALGASVRWNAFGTPASIARRTGSLGAVSGTDAVASARTWLTAHTALLGISPAQVAGLTLVNNQPLARSNARAVLFRQDFGGPTPALDSMVTVGIGRGAVQYVSSSLTRTAATSVPAATLSPTAAWRIAAGDVGKVTPLSAVGTVFERAGWSRFAVTGFAQPQLARLRSLAYADGTVRPVFETNVVDVAGGSAEAWTLMVDAISGKVLVRTNQVDNSSDSFPFQGSVTASACGPRHPFALTDDSTRTIVATFAEVVTSNDITLKLFAPSGALLTSTDTATSPEVLTYTAASLAKGTYAVQVCPYADPSAPFVDPGAYAGNVTTGDSGNPGVPAASKPLWRSFAANPALDWSPSTTPKNDVIGCWTPTTGCTETTGPFENVAAPGPWDLFTKTGTPTFTTIGNNATTHEAWLDPDAPGGLAQAPYSPTRAYTTPFTDAWNNARCNPANLTPGGNDIDNVVTNLFVSHNRMHDFSYYLGFTETNYNLQTDNLGRNEDPTRAGDPEVGNAQAGALSGGNPSYLGRDNANQIALQDGIPGITNQYLFQPIAGGFYSPCADGSLDMTVVGHEYTHAISNRMVGGPDEGLTSNQGGAMGESWSDLDAMEYLFEHGYSTGAGPWVVGPYATGNKTVGIRDYAIDASPLNYSDYGFDSPGDEVHADGEIWNAAQYEVRKALVAKYDARFPSTDKALQLRCARSTKLATPLPVEQCPGNRRWLQLLYDSFLLQQGATSMLDARDATLAADRMRFDGANQKEIWDAFARRGMGSNASTPDADSGDTVPGFVSPTTTPATVTFAGSDGTSPAKGTVYIGTYEARATPVADTDPATALPATVKLTPGSYQVLFVGKGIGMTRHRLTVTAGQKVASTLTGARNLVSANAGATVIGSSAGSLNALALIDDTESTSWAGVNVTDPVDTAGAHPYVSIDLPGTTARTIRTVKVSAMLRPAPPGPTDGLPLLAGQAKVDDDPDSGARFSALRKFAVEVCTASCSAPTAVWKRIYTSAGDAFPAVAPRPVAPNLTLRDFNVPDTLATAVRLVALENQCSGAPAYAGEQDDDPTAGTDCKANTDTDLAVRAAEFEVF